MRSEAVLFNLLVVFVANIYANNVEGTFEFLIVTIINNLKSL